MDVREYSEEVRRVVRMVGSSRVICHLCDAAGLNDESVMMAQWKHELITEFPFGGYYRLTTKGRDLLRQMEREESAAAQHRDEHEFRAQVSGHAVFESPEIMLRSTDGTLFSDRTFLSSEYNVILMPIEPEPLCPVCGKPAGEHRDGLFCCGHCEGEAMLWAPVTAHMGWTAHCNNCKIRTTEHGSAEGARAAWNRRA